MVRFCTSVLFGALSGSVFGASSLSSPSPPIAACASPQSALSPDEFRPFKLLSARYESHDTRRLLFRPEDPNAVVETPAVSCLVAKVPNAPNGTDALRPFTPIGAIGASRVEILVQMRPKDNVSAHLFQMQPGEELMLQGPFLRVGYKRNQWAHVGMLASGTGIAPMYQILQKILPDAKDTTRVSLIYANNARRDILLANELLTLQKTYPNFNLYLTLLEVPRRWLGGIGYINESMVRTFMPKPGERHSMLLVSGPTEMMDAIAGDKVFTAGKPPQQGPLKGLLRDMGYKETEVFKF